MKIDLQTSEVQFALKVIRAGAQIARRVLSEGAVRSLTKSDNSPVTLADMGIQAVAGALWEQSASTVPLVAEENADVLRRPEGVADLEKIVDFSRDFFPKASPQQVCDWIDCGTTVPTGSFWTLDPIDGTRGFLRGGQYVTALALIRDGILELAALGCPNLKTPEKLGDHQGLLVLAVRGKGCWGAALGHEDLWIPFQVSDCKEMAQARILESMELSHRNAERGQCIRKKMGIIPEPMLMDSQAKHAVLAMGGAEIFYRMLSKKNSMHREKIWDVAPGAFVIEEAGGRVTDLEGKPMDYTRGVTLSGNPGFVATNGYLHEKVLKVLSELAE